MYSSWIGERRVYGVDLSPNYVYGSHVVVLSQQSGYRETHVAGAATAILQDIFFL